MLRRISATYGCMKKCRKRWKIITIYIAVTLLFFLLNYSLLIVGKLLVGSYNIFIFPNGGWRILFLVWLVELVIVGLLLSNRSIQKEDAPAAIGENKYVVGTYQKFSDNQ